MGYATREWFKSRVPVVSSGRELPTPIFLTLSSPHGFSPPSVPRADDCCVFYASPAGFSHQAPLCAPEIRFSETNRHTCRPWPGPGCHQGRVVFPNKAGTRRVRDEH